MSERAAHWNKAYGARAEDHMSWFEAGGGLSLELIAKHGDPAGGVLIAGAGLSRLVDDLVAQDVQDIAVLDISKDAVAHVLARFPEHDLNGIVADITSWTPDRQYSVWQDRAVFHFLTSEPAQEAYLRAAQQAVAPKGLMLIATFAEDGPQKCSGLPVTRYSGDALIDRVRQTCGSAFEPIETLRHDHHTPAGNLQPFTFVVFRRVA